MRLMRAAGFLSLLTSTVVGGCGSGPTDVEEDLVGFWILAHRETPTVFGLTSGQVIFRDDGTFLFQGTNPMSTASLGEFVVTGTWNRAGDRVTLVSGDGARTWNVMLEGGEARFADPESGDGFTIFRPPPD